MDGTLLAFINRFVPPHLRGQSSASLYRARAFIAFVLSIIAISVFYVVLLFFGLNAPSVGCAAIFAAVANVALLLLFSRLSSFELAAHAHGFIPATAIVWAACLTGGFGSTALLWLFVIPMAVTLLAGSRAGAIWVGVDLLIINAVFAAHCQGFSMPNVFTGNDEVVFRWLTLMAAPALVLMLCFSYERLWLHAERETREQRSMASSIFDAAEVERRCFAYDIHDGLIPLLAGAAMHLDTLASRLPGKEDEDLVQIRKCLTDAITEGRRLVNGLRPPILDDFGVVAGIEHLAAESRRYGVEVRVDIQTAVADLSSTQESFLFRICQESLTNAIKHGRADSVAIQLFQDHGELQLTVTDNGVGFDPARVDQRRFGLRGIRERASLLGGSATITSHPGSGTIVQVMLPVEQPVSS